LAAGVVDSLEPATLQAAIFRYASAAVSIDDRYCEATLIRRAEKLNNEF
jgi:hypothetical protein